MTIALPEKGKQNSPRYLHKDFTRRGHCFLQQSSHKRFIEKIILQGDIAVPMTNEPAECLVDPENWNHDSLPLEEA